MDDYLRFYQNLAIAVIVEACRDYRYGSLSDKGFYSFCKSSWCNSLLALIGCRDFDGKELYKRMKEEKENGISTKKGHHFGERLQFND